MIYTIYVDSQNGSDYNTGEITSPVATLSYALSQVYEGGVIVLQNGNGSSYGNLSVSKNLTIKAAYGASPKVGSLTFSGMQGLIEGLYFNNLIFGINASNLDVGSLIIRNCHFNGVTTPVIIDSVHYVAIHRNNFDDYETAVRITSANEVCFSSNILSNGKRSIDINSVGRLDLWSNTVYGAIDLPPLPNPDTNLRVIYKTLNAFDIAYKRLPLPGYTSPTIDGKYDVAFNVVNGPSFNYGTDFIMIYSGSTISWNGLLLDGQFAVGDVVRVMYAESGDVESGDAIRLQNIEDENSRVDSNSLSGSVANIGIGVYFTTPVKIAHNNFDGVDVWWKGAIPTGSTGMNNISYPALYRDPMGSDFRLQESSPNIDKGDPGRWDNIFNEIGVIKVDGKYTASYTGIRDNVAPFDRDMDYDLFHRGVTGMYRVTGDIGAFEYNQHETAMGDHVAEFGYDVSNPGTETGPYASVDRGYNRVGSNDLYVNTNIVPVQDGPTGSIDIPTTGIRYGRYRSKDIALSDSNIIVGTRTKDNVAIIYPSYPSLETGIVYVSPDGDDSFTGTLSSPYRTIERALRDNCSYVIVEPGVYPSFAGVTGIRLVGVERYRDINFNGLLYSNVRDGSWTGIGSFSYTKDDIILNAASDVISEFTFNGDIDLKIYATVKSDNLAVKLVNDDNSAYIKINRMYKIITYGYITNGVTYEINQVISDLIYTPDELFTNLKLRITLKSNRFYMYIDGEYLHGSYSNIFSSGSLYDFRVEFFNNGTGKDTISNISVMTGSMIGATGIHMVKSLKKMFAITGATGLQG